MRGMTTINIGHSREEIKQMLMDLEDDYRKAGISEKNYAELKKRYKGMLEKFEKSRSKENMEGDFKNGEINKEDYKNIKIVSMDRPNDTENGLENENLDEIEIEIKKDEKEGVFKKIFGRLKKQKREEGKLEVEVPETVDEAEQVSPETEGTGNEAEIQIDDGILDEGDKGKVNVDVSNNVEEEDILEEYNKIKREELGEVPPIEDGEKEMAEPDTKNEEEKAKKKGFFKSMFGKKKKDEAPKEGAPEVKEVIEKAEAPKEEKSAEAPKPEEKKLEPGEIEEVTPEVIEKLAAQMAESSGASTESIETPPEEEAEEEEGEEGPSNQKLNIELEKLKVMIEAFRDSKKASDEAIQNISENIGEIRSMVMQSDANFKTTIADMEKLEDEVAGIKPKEITKKFNEFKDTMEKDKLEMEKLQRKSDTTGEKVNEIYEMLKSIGGIENLMGLNKDIQNKLKDINEAIKYIQRIGAKTEKIFIDLSKGMEDLILLKAKQEDFDESLKNSLAAIDAFNVKLNDYATKADLDDTRGEIVMLKKQIEQIKKVLPVAELKLPESMINMRKDKEDIEMFLESLELQYDEGKINKAEYDELKKINNKKLKDIEDKLEKEWKDIDRVMKPGEDEGTTEEDSQEQKTKRKKKKTKRSRKRAKSDEDRKKKILKSLKEIKE